MENLKSIINKVLEEHVNNVIKGDAIAAAALFDDNGTIVEGQTAYSGRVAIDKAEAEQISTIEFISMKHTIDGLSSQGDYAYQLGHVTGKMKIKADNTEIDMLNKYMAAWKKQKNESWRICYFVYYP